jgi:hypothetical protein
VYRLKLLGRFEPVSRHYSMSRVRLSALRFAFGRGPSIRWKGQRERFTTNGGNYGILQMAESIQLLRVPGPAKTSGDLKVREVEVLYAQEEGPTTGALNARKARGASRAGSN